MRQFRNIAVNSFMELVRQPVFLLLLLTGFLSFETVLALPGVSAIQAGKAGGDKS